jgi:peptidoglycan/LPS O-acetylase OafA/YrhL
METKLTEQESLAVINEMISRAQNNIQKGSGSSIVFNGCAVAFVAVANFVLLHLLPETARNYSFNVWWLMLIANVIDRFMKRKIDRSKIVKTQIDGIISYIWKGFGISVILMLVMIFSMAIFNPYGHKYNWIYSALITPTIMIMTGMAEFAMAKACRYKPFLWGAICFWAGVILCLLSYILLRRGDLQFLILAACMIVGFVIPGCRLNKKAKDHV